MDTLPFNGFFFAKLNFAFSMTYNSYLVPMSAPSVVANGLIYRCNRRNYRSVLFLYR